jgi:hypothetical protein
MKPRAANLNDLRTPEMPNAKGPKEDNNILGIVITTIIGTTLVILPMWAMHQNQLKKRITFIEKQLDDVGNNPGKNTSNS